MMDDTDLGAEVVSRSEFTEQIQKQGQMLGRLFDMLNLNEGGLPSGATTTADAAGTME